jgi:hypothetical protein
MAGVLDGDGHIGICKHPTFTPAIQFVNESKPLMNWAILHFGGSVRKENIPSGKEFYRWVLYGKQAQRKFIDEVLPFLVIKKSQAEVLKRFLALDQSDYDPEKRNELFLEIRQSRALSSVETDTQNRPQWFESRQQLAAYTAGLVDTDGHIAHRVVLTGKQAGSFRSRLEIVNIHQPILHYLQREFGGGVYEKADNSDPIVRHVYPRFRWVVSGKKDQERLLLALLPYLIVKRDRANEMLTEIRKRLKIQSDLRSDTQSAPTEMLAA